jgi:NAD(P)-dependent dehydrogenase (short-subunit alcohol dehydrogenase family)
MSRVFITGSSAGLGLMVGRLLAEQGHQVVLHARDEQRAANTRTTLSAAADVVVGDASRLKDLQRMAEQLNRMSRFDAVIHNVGIGYREPRRIPTEDGLPHVFAINVIAPYVLTARMKRPTRLVYLSSGMHQRVQAILSDITWEKRSWIGSTGYAESKLYDTPLWHSRLRGVGPTSSQMRWSRVGWLRGWVAPVRRMIFTKPTLHRHGWRSAMNRRRL